MFTINNSYRYLVNGVNAGTLTVNTGYACTLTVQSRNGYVDLNKSELTFTSPTFIDTVTVTAKDDIPVGASVDYVDVYKGTILVQSQRVKVITTDISSTLFQHTSQTHTHWQTAAQLNTLRNNFIGWLFGAGYGAAASLPTTLPDSVAEHSDDAYMAPSGFTNLLRTDVATVTWAGNSGTYTQKIYHFVPVTSNNKLMCVWYGHGDAYDMNGFPLVFKKFSDLGYHVITTHMVGRGPNTPGDGLTTGWTAHRNMYSKEVASPFYNPMKNFLIPYIVGINWMLHDYPAITNVYCTGLSGGGWATTIHAAIDKRIEKSFALSGFMPNWVRAAFDPGTSSYTDYEQGYDGPTGGVYTDGTPANVTTATVASMFNYYCSGEDYMSMAAQGSHHYSIANLVDPDGLFMGLYTTVYKDDIKEKVTSYGVFDAFTFSNSDMHGYNQAVVDAINALL